MLGCCKHEVPKGYRQNYNERPLTRKFYARHDIIDDPQVKEKAYKHELEIQRRIDFDLRKERLSPMTENQMYGWLENRGMPYDPTDLAQSKCPRTTEDDLKIQAAIMRQMQQVATVVRK